MPRHLLPVALLGLFIPASLAQDTKKDDPKGTEVDVHFLNGSSVRMRLQSDKLEIATPYGKLAVPVKDVRSIEFGVHFPEGIAEKIEAAVKNLGHKDYRERENAVAALVDLGPYSYAAAMEASRLPEAEASARAKMVIQKLQAKHPRKDLRIAADDKVITPTFTIVGRILTTKLKAKTEYFGDVELNVATMRTLRTIGAPGPAVEVAIDAAKYATQGQWLATDFHVDGRSTIVITAKGQVDLMPGDPGIYVVGPSGVRTGGPGVAFPKKAKATAGGVLIGKIGENGDTFIIGDRFEGTPAQAGRLYLHINPSIYSAQSSGSYDVRAMRKD